MYGINKERPPRKVLRERESKYNHIRTGHCPHCQALMSYRGKKITECLCCGFPVEWELNESND